MAAKISESLFSLSSLLMASLFAISASFQFNDPDWFFWFPLYICGCIVNLVNGLSKFPMMRLRTLAKFSLWLGVFLFIKVAVEGALKGMVAGFWSLDMRERIVREKLGSGLVIGSMFLHLQKKPSSRHQPNGQETEVAKLTKYGMPTLAVIRYGLSILFYLCHQKEMKF
ncbi:hypothetical protein ACH5RR_014130 [Cinchona calisaya]|uniref:Uncharacterized protein n=1 Tax=Cinchona calisaya TaxID=153742 RepID=A0ABD3A3I7_9GENT